MDSKDIYQIIYSVLAGEATVEERHIFMKWLDASEANQTEYIRLKHLYDAITPPAKEEKIYDTDRAWLQVCTQTIDKKKTFRFPLWSRYAAMVAIVVSVGLFILSQRTHTPVLAEVNMEEFDEPTLLLDNGERVPLAEKSFSREEKHVVIKNDANSQLVYESEKESGTIKEKNNHLVIPKGKTYQVLLSDGTRIWLNSETELTYPTHFAGNERKITLIGEAYFEVAKNKEKPFIVNANGMEVKVLGTSFNISCYTSDEMFSTTLVEGSVAVKAASSKPETLAPSEQFTFSKEKNMTAVRIVNTELFTSWMDGKYIFKDAPLDEIVRKLQRWYDFSVRYEDENLKSNRYSLEIDRNTNLDQLLEVISYTSNVKLERTNRIINIQLKKEGK